MDNSEDNSSAPGHFIYLCFIKKAILSFMAQSQRYITARRVTAVNATTNVFLAFFKITVGYFGHSYALVTDGIHSLSDLISDALILIAARIGGRIPDQEHPYGHQRIETLAAIIIALLLLIIGGSIVYDTLQHIRLQKSSEIHNLPVLLAALISMAAKEALYRYTLHFGKKIHSDLLVSSAYHNRSDVWISALVILSAIGHFLKIPYADPLVAAIIALLIVKAGMQLFYKGIRELIDTGVDEAQLTHIRECIQSIPGVISAHQLRTRSHGGNIFVDTHILVNTFISVSEGHHIGEKVHAKLIKHFSQIADVVVHIDPENDEVNKPSLGLPSRPEIIALLKQHWHNLPGYELIDKIDIHYFNGQIYLEVRWSHEVFLRPSWSEINEQYSQITHSIPYIALVKLMVYI